MKYLGTFRDSVLGQFTREDEADSGLDLASGDGGLLGFSGRQEASGDVF